VLLVVVIRAVHIGAAAHDIWPAIPVIALGSANNDPAAMAIIVTLHGVAAPARIEAAVRSAPPSMRIITGVIVENRVKVAPIAVASARAVTMTVGA